eukprot:6492749-Amphidinium_carterae.9
MKLRGLFANALPKTSTSQNGQQLQCVATFGTQMNQICFGGRSLQHPVLAVSLMALLIDTVNSHRCDT